MYNTAVVKFVSGRKAYVVVHISKYNRYNK